MYNYVRSRHFGTEVSNDVSTLQGLQTHCTLGYTWDGRNVIDQTGGRGYVYVHHHNLIQYSARVAAIHVDTRHSSLQESISVCPD